MRYRIETVKTTADAAYNYDGAMRDAIHALNEATYWLMRMTDGDNPDSLKGDENDRKWARAKVEQVRELVKQANLVKFGRDGVSLA